MGSVDEEIHDYLDSLPEFNIPGSKTYYLCDDGGVAVIAPYAAIRKLWFLEYKTRIFAKITEPGESPIEEMEVVLKDAAMFVVTHKALKQYDLMNKPPYAGKFVVMRRKGQLRGAVAFPSQIYINIEDKGAVNMSLVLNYPLDSGEVQRLYPIFPLPILPLINKRVRRVNGRNAQFI